MQIFISYKSEYVDFAKRLFGMLKTWGFDPWLDVFNIPPGTTRENKGWDEAIHLAMKAAEVVIGLLTPEAIKSDNVLDEWGWALSNKRRLFLLWLGDLSEEEIPPRYIRIQRIDFRHDETVGLAKLQAALSSPALLMDTPSIQDSGVKAGAKPRSVLPWIQPQRKQMIDKVRAYWIEGVLDLALSDSEFDLGLTLKPDAVLTHADYGDYTLSSTSAIARIFNDLGKELLILGAPGSGKTTLMLQLARELLRQAELNGAYPIPVVFNLSSWTGRQSVMEKWLEEELVRSYQISASVAHNWVADERILPLLDGLDEVLLEKRDDCVAAINHFRTEFRTVSLVVCSRIADYELLTNRLELRSAILLQPLSPEQTEQYVTSKPGWNALAAILKSDATLQDMATNPFLLNTMLFSYDGLNEYEIGKNLERQERLKHLFDQYIKRRFEIPGDYTISETRKRLSWLGYQMNKQSESMFFVDDLYSPQWGIRRRLSPLGGIVVGVIMLGSLFPVFAFLLTPIYQLDAFAPLSAIATIGLIGFASLPCVTGFWIALLSSGIIGGAKRMTTYQRGTRITPRLRAVVIGIAGLVVSTVGWVIYGVLENSLHYYSSAPSYWTNLSLVNFFELVVMLFTVAAGVVVVTNVLALVIPMLYRFYLSRRRPVPYRYPQFLDFAVQRGLMRHVGRGYIVRHRTLLEYFAGLQGKR